MVMINEVTHREQVKMLRELDRCKDETMAIVTHDLKTPLNGIIAILSSHSNSNASAESLKRSLPLLLSATESLKT